MLLVSYLVLGLSWVNRACDEFVINLGFDQGCDRCVGGRRLMSRLQDGQSAKLSARHRRRVDVAGVDSYLGVQGTMSDFPIITILTLLPLIGGVIVAGLGRTEEARARFGAGLRLFVTGNRVGDVESIRCLVGRSPIHRETRLDSVAGSELFRWCGRPWAADGDAHGHRRADGDAGVVGWAAVRRTDTRLPTHIYFALVLFLQAGLFGTFTALNFFHWFIFWELSLIPAFFLIRLWGGPQRAPAATQFFIYTMVGSVAMLLAFLANFPCDEQFQSPGRS